MEDAALHDLSEVLAQLEGTPRNVPLLERATTLMQSLGLDAEYIDTTNRLAGLVMLSSVQWNALFANLLSRDITLDTLVDILEVLDRCEQDYLSGEAFRRHATFLVSVASDDAEVQDFLTDDTRRQMLAAVAAKVDGLLDESHTVWQIWLDWELARIAEPDQVDLVHQLFVDRLKVPHNQIQSTFDAYSTFCSTHSPDDYETRLVAATEASQVAKKILAEKRFGKTRTDFEDALSTADLANKIAIFSSYLDWETNPKTRNQNAVLASGVFERAVLNMSLLATAPETSQYYKDAEAALWTRYGTWSNNIDVFRRGVRACPGSGLLWGELCLDMERSAIDGIDDVYESALEIGILLQPGAPVTAITDLFISRAAYDSRVSADVVATITRGLEAIHHLSTAGDPACRLERFLLEWAETRSPGHLDQVMHITEKPNKSRSASYQMVLLRASVEARRHNDRSARHIYSTAIERSDLDWPEAVYEAYIQFELLHGTIDTLAAAKEQVRKEQEKTLKRRQKAAEAYVPEPAEITSAPNAPAEAPVEAKDEPKRDREHTTILVSGLPSTIDTSRIESFFGDCGAIREVTLIDVNDSKSALVEFRFADAVPAALARNHKRLNSSEIAVSMLWRSTLFITNFDKNFDDAKARELFGQHGYILSTRWPSRKYAESRRFCYITMESPAAAQNALALHGDKTTSQFGLSVLVSDPAAKKQRTDAGQTTLFVGGISPETTEADIREQFEKHGQIHYIKIGRDQSGKCKGFAFIDMTSEAQAKSALALDGAHLNGRFLRVSIKDPNHEKKAPSGDRHARTVRLHNVPENTQEGLLQQALEKLVPVKRLEMFTKTHEAIAELVSQADMGKLLLRTEPFVFDGATITFSEATRRKPPHVEQKPASSLSFAPRAARKPAKTLGKGRPAQAAPTVPAASGQDSFRALVDEKNKKREHNLAVKRGAEETAEPEAKRTKQ